MKPSLAVLLIGLAAWGSGAVAQTTSLEFFDRIAGRYDTGALGDGFSGNATLGYATEIDGDPSHELRAGALLRYSTGDFMQSLGVSVNVSDVAGASKRGDLFAIYDARFTLRGNVYAFVLGRVTTDRQADSADEIRRDAFLGVGPGIRLVDTDRLAWRVQAGVGVSHRKDGTGDTATEGGVIASSRLVYAFHPRIVATDDIDVVKTGSALRVSNDFGVDFRISDAMSMRTSYLTEYNDSRAVRTENRVGLALVVEF